MAEFKGVPVAGPQLQLSPLLLGSLIGAVLATIAVATFTVVAETRPVPPPNLPPPPPDTTGLIVSVGLFVVAWVAVLAAIVRDQLLRSTATLGQILVAIEDFGDRRDTEGYLRAVRTAGQALPTQAPGEVRQLYRVPPPTPPTP